MNSCLHLALGLAGGARPRLMLDTAIEPETERRRRDDRPEDLDRVNSDIAIELATRTTVSDGSRTHV
jgi:hypothetical protein